jgi:hypothetical protein
LTFDILFCARNKSDVPDFDRIKQVLSVPQNVAKSPTAEKVQTIEYENKATEVYLQLAHSDQDAGTEVHGAPHLIDSGLIAHVNFGRPTYFARECFETLQSMSRKLGLFLFYGQPISPSEVPNSTTSQMLEQWTRINTDSVKRIRDREGGRIRFIPKEKLDSVWNYNTHKAQLYATLGDRYFIPLKIFAIERAGNLESRCYTCCGWPDFKTEVVPLVDYVIVKRPDHPKLTGLVGLSDISDILGESYHEASEPVYHVQLDRPSVEQMKAIQAKIAILEEHTKIVPFDSIVDVPP